MPDLTPSRLAELRRIAEAAVPGKWLGQDFQLAMTPRTALALLDRIESLEADVRLLRETLLVIEWADGHCPWCGNRRNDGHRFTCQLNSALRGARSWEDGGAPDA